MRAELMLVSVGLLCWAQVWGKERVEVDKDVSEDQVKKKREELRWFPADQEDDCDQEPGLEQVRERMG